MTLDELARRLADVEADRDALFDRVSDLEIMLVAKLSQNRVRRLLGMVADAFGFDPEDLIAQCREAPVTEARFAFYYIARQDLSLPQSAIARVVDRDHTSISHGLRRAKAIMEASPEFRLKINRIRARLREWAGDPLASRSQPENVPARSALPKAAPV